MCVPYQAASQAGRGEGARGGGSRWAASHERIAGVSPSRMRGGARSAISAFCSRWISSNRFAAIVSSGELSDAATRRSPMEKTATRQRGGGSERAAHAYAPAAAAASTRKAGSKLKLVALTRVRGEAEG